MNWRKWNYLLHRDIGFICVGLTLLYALSGIAVNHVRDWNPNYQIEKSHVVIGPIQAAGIVSDTTVHSIMQRLAEKKYAESFFQPDAENVWIYVDGRVIKAHLPSGKVELERFERRPFWYRLNFLHLNHAKGGWTWMADLYAVALTFLAISGLMMLRKKTMRRGLLLTGAGVIIPILFLLIYY
jgi:hypothetical protein